MPASTAAAPREFSFTPHDFARARELILRRAGIALGPHKADMVYSRLVRRVRSLGLKSFAAYLDLLESGAAQEEWETFTGALTTHLTAFFREPHHFDALRTLFARRPEGRRLRLWSGASSTGEEPYSMAITAVEHYDSFQPPVSILATDVDVQVLATAHAGIYPLERVAGFSRDRLKRFFRKGTGAREGYCKVADELRALVEFRPLNLLAPHWDLGGAVDAAFIRNVMIYFDKPTQQAILERVRRALAPDGLMFAGHSESLVHASNLFRSCGRTVYTPVAEGYRTPSLARTAGEGRTARGASGGVRADQEYGPPLPATSKSDL